MRVLFLTWEPLDSTQDTQGHAANHAASLGAESFAIVNLWRWGGNPDRARTSEEIRAADVVLAAWGTSPAAMGLTAHGVIATVEASPGTVLACLGHHDNGDPLTPTQAATPATTYYQFPREAAQ